MKSVADKDRIRLTLDRFLSKSGIASRTEAKEIVRSGRIRVNGKIIKDDQYWIRLSTDTVKMDGLRIRPQRKIYLMFNKSKGVVTTRADEKGRRTVYDYLTDIKSYVFPVGRLDKNTSGLLILTNDTNFGNRLTDPESKVYKTYLAKVSGLVSDEEIQRLSAGIILDRGEKTLPAVIRRTKTSEKHSWLEVIIVEGKNRQVRRMFEAINRAVLKLVRVRIGNLPLGSLEVGKYRHLSPDEKRALLQRRSKSFPGVSSRSEDRRP